MCQGGKRNGRRVLLRVGRRGLVRVGRVKRHGGRGIPAFAPRPRHGVVPRELDLTRQTGIYYPGRPMTGEEVEPDPTNLLTNFRMVSQMLQEVYRC